MTRAEAAEVVDRCLGPYASALLDSAAQPFLVTDLQANILRANRAFREMLGYSAGEMETLTISEITPEAWLPTSIEARQRLLAEGRPRRYEKEYCGKNGDLVPVDLVADVFRDERGDPIGFFSFITDISERKRSDEALRASESRFRHLFDEAPFGYHEIDEQGVIVSINLTECEILGYQREEMIGRPIFDFIADEEQRAEARKAVAEKLRGERPLHPFERVYRRRDGRTLIVSIRERLRIGEDGRVLGLRSTVQDVTEQKQMEAALISSERKARALFEGIEDAVFVHDLQGHILDANPAASRRLGYSREEFLRLTTRDIDAGDFAEAFEQRIAHQLRQGNLSCEGRHRTRDGRIIPVDINSSTIQYEDQTAILAVVRDITERKALEETRRQFAESQMRNAEEVAAKNRALMDSEARYRQLTEASIDAVVVADERGQITLFNPAAEKTFGYAAEEILGLPLNLILPGDDQISCTGESLRVDRQREQPRLVGRTVELRGRRQDGEVFPLELSLNTVGTADKIQYLGSIRDLTERQRMRDMLVQTEKLASIGLLCAGVAHEINNPLAYVANNLAVLERDLKGVLDLIACYESTHDRLATVAPEALLQAEEIREDLDWDYVRNNLGRLISRTRDGVQRVANIVQNLRSLARTAPPKKEETYLPDLVTVALEMVRGKLKRENIKVEVDAPPRLATIPCVSNQIGQVLLNLMINAAQAIQSSGITEGGCIRIVFRDQDDTQVIEVIDNGCGIAQEDLPKLFDPFFTTKVVGEGTGLGLSISHGIVTGHGGQIEGESQPERGTCFRITLPRNP
ncbi:hypothetical protein BH23PLA1_BH23PLA1_17350 [soil metagenome]